MSQGTSMYTAQGKIDPQAQLEAYLPMVRRQALALQVRLPAGVDLDDLIQAGMLGLIEALGRYDPSQGAQLSTYASQRVHGAMLDELRSRDWLPRRVRRHARALETTIRELQQKLGRVPEEREIAATMDMDLVSYRQLLGDINNGLLLPFEDILEEKGEQSFCDQQSSCLLSELIEGEQRQALIDAIAELPEREKLLMGLYYQEELNLKEIGAVLGVSESRVCQLHSQAIRRLRSQLCEY